MKLIPNIQKELDALMADPLNYQDPHGILASTREDPRWVAHSYSLADAFILVEVSDFEVAGRLITENIKSDRGKQLRNAYARVAKNLEAGVRQEEVLRTGNGSQKHKDFISPYYSLFMKDLLVSLNHRKSWHSKVYDEYNHFFPNYDAILKLEEALITPAADFRRSARTYHSDGTDFKKALSNSADYLKPFV